MATHTPTHFRRDAGASIFTFGVAGIALLFHVTSTVLTNWSASEITLEALDPKGRVRTILIDTADVPGWVVLAVRSAEVVEWGASAAVLVLLSLCVVGMLRGDVFTSSTARWVGWAGTIIVAFMLVVPGALRVLATNMALQNKTGDWDAHAIGAQFWYLYVGAMTLSFVALVLRRGCQLQEDQEGLI